MRDSDTRPQVILDSGVSKSEYIIYTPEGHIRPAL